MREGELTDLWLYHRKLQNTKPEEGDMLFSILGGSKIKERGRRETGFALCLSLL